MPQCASCNAGIVWALSPAGKRSPIDVAIPSGEHVGKGNILMLSPRGYDMPLAVTLSGDALVRANERKLPLHLNHWATCADREEWRTRQKAKAGSA